MRFLNRQLSLPVSTMSQWWVSAAGLKEDALGRERTAYSFRHTYASNQIRKGTDIYTLAINMRTSVRMIEMYYSDVVPDEMAKQLEGSC